MLHKTHRPHLSIAQDARALRTREALRQALLGLLETKSLEQISIRDIAAGAGVSYTTFFRHHTTKEALLDEIAADQIRRFVELGMPKFDVTNARAASLALCAYVNEHRKLWATLLTGGAASALREEFLRIASELAAERPDPLVWLPPDLVTILVVSSTIELLTWWLRQEKPFSVERIAEIHDLQIVAPALRRKKISEKVARTGKK